MPVTRQQLEELAEGKASDALLLLAEARFTNAYYLAGFAIEIALKACIATQFRRHVVPDKKLVNDLHTHNLATLIDLAGLRQELAVARGRPAFDARWRIVELWRPDSRYEIVSRTSARSLVDAVTNAPDGVLPWARTFWRRT